MFVDETYSIAELAHKFGLPTDQVELGMRRSGARAVEPEGRATYSYEAVWQYVHRFLNHEHFAAWEHNAERVAASDMNEVLTAEITADWSESTRTRLARIIQSVNGSPGVFFMLHRILHIDPECPACGHFPWIVGYDGRQASTGLILSIYVCPGCGYLFLKR